MLARLYDDMGVWDKETEIDNRLHTEHPGEDATLHLDLLDRLQSEDVSQIQAALDAWKHRKDAKTPDPVAVAADATIAWLKGNGPDGAKIARDYISSSEFDTNTAMTLLRLDVENADFQAFESDLKMCFDKLGATAWLDAGPDQYPMPTDTPQAVARLLDWAATFELGRGNRETAGALLDRALSLDPYDSAAKQQVAFVKMADQDIESAFKSLDEAAKPAPPTDVRVRERLLEFSLLESKNLHAPWDEKEIGSELTGIVAHREQQYPESAVFKWAEAERKRRRGGFCRGVTDCSGCMQPAWGGSRNAIEKSLFSRAIGKPGRGLESCSKRSRSRFSVSHIRGALA